MVSLPNNLPPDGHVHIYYLRWEDGRGYVGIAENGLERCLAPWSSQGPPLSIYWADVPYDRVDKVRARWIGKFDTEFPRGLNRKCRGVDVRNHRTWADKDADMHYRTGWVRFGARNGTPLLSTDADVVMPMHVPRDCRIVVICDGIVSIPRPKGRRYRALTRAGSNTEVHLCDDDAWVDRLIRGTYGRRS